MMTQLQLLLFSWIATWVLAESFSPGISYSSKLQASLIAMFAVGYANNAHRVLWKKLTKWKR